LFIVAVCTASFALEDQKIQQFAHATWGADQGAPQIIFAIAQTADDYLWIGSAEGLIRFDGLTFERYRARPEAPLPAGRVISLLALPDGDLWIGFESGVRTSNQHGKEKSSFFY
jgi:ligand-binding sensor domain-containing protein